MPPVVLVIRKIPLFSIIFLGIGTLLYSSPNLLFPYTGYTNFSLERYFFPYVIGVIIYMMIGKINLLPSLQKRFTSNFPLISLFICFFLYAINPPYWNPELVVSVWIGLLLIVLSQPSILRTIVFENRIILFFGTISYPFYLLHYVVKDSISAYLSTSNQVIILILSLAITTLLGCFFHWIFEIWLVKKLRPKTYPAARS
jgi:peptidoglycan/LPS O-acetylase OafA/YrhL